MIPLFSLSEKQNVPFEFTTMGTIDSQINTKGDDVFLDSLSDAMDSIFMAHDMVLPPRVILVIAQRCTDS